MSCQEACQLIDAYVDQELDLVRSLDADQTCAQSYIPRVTPDCRCRQRRGFSHFHRHVCEHPATSFGKRYVSPASCLHPHPFIDDLITWLMSRRQINTP